MSTMERFLITLALGGAAMGQWAFGQSRQAPTLDSQNLALVSSTDLPAIPPAPGGTSTTFGGTIAGLDPVRDRLTLRMTGQRPMMILFDERTAVYRNGNRIRLSDLALPESASVETTLDGSHLFALSIHLLTDAQQDELQGRVAAYDPVSGELRIISDEASASFTLRVDKDTQIVREGQTKSASTPAGTSDLVSGTLVSLDFISSGGKTPEATRIRILALPGMAFVFSGRVSSLDEHLGRLVLSDSLNGESYVLFFNSSSLPAARTIHLQDAIRVTADYDGTRYVARDIAAGQP